MIMSIYIYIYKWAFTILLFMCFGLYRDYFVGYCFVYVLQSDYNKISLCLRREMWREASTLVGSNSERWSTSYALLSLAFNKQTSRRQCFERRVYSSCKRV